MPRSANVCPRNRVRYTARYGRASLVVLARLRRLKALDCGEHARDRGASWTVAEDVTEQAVRALD